jgi:hypothetical protein
MYSDNTSGHGDFAQIPEGLNKWNWGAFWLTWIWGIFNGCYIALLVFIPVISIFMPFYLGAKGNELAWRNRQWDDADELKNVQKKWSIAGWIVFAAVIILFSVRYANEVKANRLSSEIANKVIVQIMKNEEGKKLLGDDYTLQTRPALLTVTGTEGTIPMSISMFISTKNGILFVSASLTRDYNIEKITISPPYSDENLIIDVH